ncbi:MAG: hypothetical protein AAF787_23885 [Chloroflexota bacterium]
MNQLLSIIFSRNTDAFIALLAQPDSTWLAARVVFFALLSESVGQSVILFAHKVKPRRFFASLLVNALLYAVRAFLYVIIVYVLTRFILDETPTFRELSTIVGLLHAPLLLGFLGFLPYAGKPILQILEAYMFILIVGVLSTFLSISFWRMLLITAVAYGIFELLSATIGKPLNNFANALQRRVAGTNFDLRDESVLPGAADKDD